MNATQYKLPVRLGDFGPLDIKVRAETPAPSPYLRNAVCRHPKSEAETDAGYGCVDWYQYPGSRAWGRRASDRGA